MGGGRSAFGGPGKELIISSERARILDRVSQIRFGRRCLPREKLYYKAQNCLIQPELIRKRNILGLGADTQILLAGYLLEGIKCRVNDEPKKLKYSFVAGFLNNRFYLLGI